MSIATSLTDVLRVGAPNVAPALKMARPRTPKTTSKPRPPRKRRKSPIGACGLPVGLSPDASQGEEECWSDFTRALEVWEAAKARRDECRRLVARLDNDDYPDEDSPHAPGWSEVAAAHRLVEAILGLDPSWRKSGGGARSFLDQWPEARVRYRGQVYRAYWSPGAGRDRRGMMCLAVGEPDVPTR